MNRTKALALALAVILGGCSDIISQAWQPRQVADDGYSVMVFEKFVDVDHRFFTVNFRPGDVLFEADLTRVEYGHPVYCGTVMLDKMFPMEKCFGVFDGKVQIAPGLDGGGVYPLPADTYSTRIVRSGDVNIGGRLRDIGGRGR